MLNPSFVPQALSVPMLRWPNTPNTPYKIPNTLCLVPWLWQLLNVVYYYGPIMIVRILKYFLTGVLPEQWWFWQLLNSVYKYPVGDQSKKITGLFGSFSQVSDTPPPPYLGGLRPKNQKIQKKIKTCFSSSEWFWHAKNYLVKSQKFWDLGEPLPPVWEKLPKNPVFFFWEAP